MSRTPPGGFSRRSLIRAAGLGATVPLPGACGGLKGTGSSSSDVLKIGYVSPQTGPLAGFASADNFVVQHARHHQPRRRPVRGQRHPERHHDRALGGVVPRVRRQDRRGVAKLLVYLVSAAGCGAAGGVITVSSLPRGLWGVVRDRTGLGLFPVGYFVRTGESGAGVPKAVPHTNN